MDREKLEEMLLKDERTPWLNVHSAYDEMPLTVDAFRALAHLSRKADNKTGQGNVSYRRMGETCYRATYPNSSSDALRQRAIKAVRELQHFGLVKKLYNEASDGRQIANAFALTHKSEWNLSYRPGAGTNVRGLGKPGKRGGVTGDTPSVSPVTPAENQEGGVVGDTPGGVVGDTPGGVVGDTLLKGNPYSGNPYSGNPFGGAQKKNAADRAKKQEPEPEQSNTPASIPDQADTSTRRKSGARQKSSAARRKPKSAAEIYGLLIDLAGFESFWEWYRLRICPIRASGRDGATAEEGSKAEAAWAWYQLEDSDFLGQGRDRFREGCRLQSAKYGNTGGLGIPHAFRFLYPSTGEPPWLLRLQEQDAPVVTEEFLPGPPPVPPVAATVRMSRSDQVSATNQQVLEDWKRKKRAEMAQSQQTVEVRASYV